MPPRSHQKAVQFVRKNEDGEILTWDRHSADAATLRVIVENGLVNGMKPSKVRENFKVFEKYAGATFRSALQNARKTYEKSVYNRAAALNTGMFKFILLIYPFTPSHHTSFLS